MALMPQWDFLDFLAQEARHYPTFNLRMGSEATDLLVDGNRVGGVVLNSGEEIRARLTIAADGRASMLRDKAQLPRKDLSAPIDVLWFRLPKAPTPTNITGGTFGAGAMVVQIDRGDYWQCAYVVPKGAAEEIESKGMEAFRKDVAHAAPELASAVDTLRDWDQVKLLSVSLDRLTCWWRPGLLAIGDAAHAMSPVGGVGINLAIQDAVAAANILAAPLAAGQDVDPLLEEGSVTPSVSHPGYPGDAEGDPRARPDPACGPQSRARQSAVRTAAISAFSASAANSGAAGRSRGEARACPIAGRWSQAG